MLFYHTPNKRYISTPGVSVSNKTHANHYGPAKTTQILINAMPPGGCPESKIQQPRKSEGLPANHISHIV